MKKIIFLLFAATFSVSCIYAQKMSDIYPLIPDSLSLLLTKDNRIELVDNYLNNKEAKIKNKLRGDSELKVLTEDYMLLQTTSNTTLEVKLLPVNEYYNIICLIQTYCSSACDSKISFYSVDWKPLKNNYFNFDPKFFILSGTECEKTQNMLDAVTVKYVIEKDGLSLIAASTTEEYMGEDTYNDIATCIKKDITYQWIDGKFR